MNMDISSYSLEDLLLAAIKSELEAEEVYLKLADRVKNPFLKGRLEFLANEERKHKAFLEGIFKESFPTKSIVLPRESVVPMPVVKLYGENGSMRDVIVVLEDAMKAEKAASEFYSSLKDRFKDSKIRKTLHYLSLMEQDHYRILQMERDQMAEVEDIMVESPYGNLDGLY